MSTNTLVSTLLAMAGQRNVITVPRAFVRFTGSLESAMMLNQLLYWKPRAHGEAIYKTDLDWADELCLTRYAVRKAREHLVSMGFLTYATHHVSGAPAVHYTVDFDVLVDRWTSWLQEQDVKFENELYTPPTKVRKRTLPDESSSKTNRVKFENEQTMNHRVPTEITVGGVGDRARELESLLSSLPLYPATVKQIMALKIDPPTLIASIHYLQTEQWGPGAIADQIRKHPPVKGQPYAKPDRRSNGHDAPDQRKPAERAALPKGLKLSSWKKPDRSE